MMLRPALPVALVLALAACGGGTTTASAPVRSTPVPLVKKPAPPPRPAARVEAAPGLEGVIGAGGDALIRQFGAPRLDIHEDDARKLQWSGTACILDVYLYPPATGAQPTATYVEARRGDGREVDRAACVAALKQR